MTVRITPSILNANLASLSDEVGRIPSADGLHIDVMDGHFVPNLVMGAPFVASLRPTTDLMFDVHLMIEDPDRWAPQYVEAGAQSVTFHLEAATAPIKLARELRAMGARASVALLPRPGLTPSWRVLPSTDSMTPTRSSPHCAIRLRRPRTAATEYCGRR